MDYHNDGKMLWETTYIKFVDLKPITPRSMSLILDGSWRSRGLVFVASVCGNMDGLKIEGGAKTQVRALLSPLSFSPTCMRVHEPLIPSSPSRFASLTTFPPPPFTPS